MPSAVRASHSLRFGGDDEDMVTLANNHLMFAEFARLVENQPGWRRIGQILIDLGYLDAARLDAALAAYRRQSAPVGLLKCLIERGDISEKQALTALTEQIMVHYLPAMATSLQRERQAAGESERLRQELTDSYRSALQTTAALNEQVQHLSQLLQMQRHRTAELERELAEARRALSHKQRGRR